MRLIEAVRLAVQRYPDNVAITDPQSSLTYDRLWREAKEEADRVPPEIDFAIIQEPRSGRLIIKLLGAWLAGKPSLLLDPDTPPLRREHFASLPPPSPGAEYLVTTSGSGGVPKVVQIGIGSLYRVIRAQIEAFGIHVNSRVGWILSPGFDASLSDIGTALCAGATLVCGETGRPDLLRDITHLDIPPALLPLFRPEDLATTLHTLVVGGEPSPPAVLREWARRFRVFSVYGPSETTVCSSMVQVDPGWDGPYLGKPLKDVVYKVDGGELIIGGPTVGLGYFSPSTSFFTGEGLNWYRTGDLVGHNHPRYGLRFLGRKDRQIQLHGQRFEPEEVEQLASSVLNTSVACEVWNNRVVMFWVSHGDLMAEEKLLESTLRRHLLPAWLPRHYVGLNEIPRNPNGKIDRPALKALADGTVEHQLTSLERLELCLHSSSQPAALNFQRIEVSRRGKPGLLLTGATGRLGSALRPLLEDKFEIWSLQRNPGTDERTFQADLTAGDFNLSSDQWEILACEIDVVLHLAARVDLTLSCAALEEINLRPLQRLASLGRPIHYASTLAVPLSGAGGYALSKQMGEQAVAGVPGLTLRYGNLISQPRGDELLAVVVGGLLELGCCPVSQDPSLCFDWTSMEWAARQTQALLETQYKERETVSLREGRHVHLNALAELLSRLYQLPTVHPADFANLAPPSETAALAQMALGKCVDRLQNPGFDLFLLGNDPWMLQTSEPVCTEELMQYLESVPTVALK